MTTFLVHCAKSPISGEKVALNVTAFPDGFLRQVKHRYSQHHFSYSAKYEGEKYLTLNLEFIMSYMSLIYQGRIGQGCEQPDLLKGVTAHGRGGGLEDL